MTALRGLFSEYFQALHGYPPFPWQRRLVAEILERGAWPDVLDIPTGLGKTSTLDIALFVLAVMPERAPRRCLLVVDRRVVVDQAAERAQKIQECLATATSGPLAAVAQALRGLWGGPPEAAPFEVAVLRGGMPRDESWAQRPDRPVVALSTVDQVGSRLLFRGYGVSAGMAPIHAGLLGCDALILLDEVQLSTAFAETLGAIQRRWRHFRDGDWAAAIPDRWAFVRMSATPQGISAKDRVFGLDDEDLGHSLVKKRREARKWAVLGKPIDVTKSDPEKSQAAVAATFSREALSRVPGAKRVAVIVNRVDMARRIHAEIRKSLPESVDAVLLTGRMRPLDREAVFGQPSDPNSVSARITADGLRSADARPIIVVATQSIEAGADFDFDVLLTECASLDALRQRFGRLDRRGELGQSQAMIFIRKDQVQDSSKDPIYGEALSQTWAWLEKHANDSRVVDLGVAGLPPLPEGEERARLYSKNPEAPVLLPAQLSAWSETNPRGWPDPEVALWLHGPRRGQPEVRVTWRADIDAERLEELVRGGAFGPGATPPQAAHIKAPSVGAFGPGATPPQAAHVKAQENTVSSSLAVAPPSSLESLSVPISAFRAWIAKTGQGDDTLDVEGVDADNAEGGERESRAVCRPYFIATTAGASLKWRAEDVFPEATVVVPASYGGLAWGNWDPASEAPVSDLGDWAQYVHRGKPVLRLKREVLESWDAGLPEADLIALPKSPAEEDADFRPRQAVVDWLEAAKDRGSERFRAIAQSLLDPLSRLRAIELGESGSYAASGPRINIKRKPSFFISMDSVSDIVGDDDDSASYTGQELSLETHLGDVARWARGFAAHLGLPEALAKDLALAARLHDLGKADPRFQQMLHGGSAVRMAASPTLIAKSRWESNDRAARQAARLRSGYPAGYRHELLSLAMLESCPSALNKAYDKDLVLHLIGSHHGWCRPMAPAVESGPSLHVSWQYAGEDFEADAAHGLAAADGGLAERFHRLTERYGWWTLAWFEAILRLADHRASEERAVASKRPVGAHSAGEA